MELNIKQNYQEMINVLKEKYGKVNENYFLKPNCKTKNNKINRTEQGLYIHHIKESDAIELSSPKHALANPWDYQTSENLVYCDLWEHFLLHTKIILENKDKDLKECVGYGGIFNFLAGDIIDSLVDYQYTDKFEYKNQFKKDIQKHKTEFIEVFSELINFILTSKSLQPIKFKNYLRNEEKIDDIKRYLINQSLYLKTCKSLPISHIKKVKLIWNEIENKLKNQA